MPSIVVVFGIDVKQNTITIAEEEAHTSTNYFTEKTVPKPLNISDFIRVLEDYVAITPFAIYTEIGFSSPFISIVSPPPEWA